MQDFHVVFLWYWYFYLSTFSTADPDTHTFTHWGYWEHSSWRRPSPSLCLFSKVCIKTWKNHHCQWTVAALTSGSAWETPEVHFSQQGEISLRLSWVKERLLGLSWIYNFQLMVLTLHILNLFVYLVCTHYVKKGVLRGKSWKSPCTEQEEASKHFVPGCKARAKGWGNFYWAHSVSRYSWKGEHTK